MPVREMYSLEETKVLLLVVLKTSTQSAGSLKSWRILHGTNGFVAFNLQKALLQHGMENTFQNFPKRGFTGFRVRLSNLVLVKDVFFGEKNSRRTHLSLIKILLLLFCITIVLLKT
jgi:hypothetical protein